MNNNCMYEIQSILIVTNEKEPSSYGVARDGSGI